MPVKKDPKTKVLKKEGKNSVIARSKATKQSISDKGLSAPLVGNDGKETGNFALSEEIFGAKINKPLLAQALRVYSQNITAHFSSTKTRGEVQGSSRKIYKQKGTGGARHGSIRAPIFVKGGIALGPKFRKIILNLPKKMKRAALLSALSLRAKEGEVLVSESVNFTKTQQAKAFSDQLNKNFLIVTEDKANNFAFQNLAKASSLGVASLNVFEVIKHQTLVFTKLALVDLETRIKKDFK